MEVKTLAMLLAETLEEVLADGHLVEVCIVRQQAFFVLTCSSDELRADDDVARVVNFLTSAVGVGQTLAESSVDRADDVGLFHGGSCEERNALGLGEAVGKIHENLGKI